MDALIGEVKELMETLNKLGLKSPRPWREFATMPLKPPKKWTKQEVEERIQSNFLLYKANYLIISAIILSWYVYIYDLVNAYYIIYLNFFFGGKG